MSTSAVLGFRPHTYWTAVVALGGALDAPQVLDRRRIVFAEGSERFVFHQAEALDRAQARALIERVRSSTVDNLRRGLSWMVEELGQAGASIAAAAVPAGRRQPPDDLDQIVRSHALMHAAEGHFYREVVAAACADAGLDVSRPPEHELGALVCDALGIDRPALDERLSALGTALGPPWTEDQRVAVLAAWFRMVA